MTDRETSEQIQPELEPIAERKAWSTPTVIVSKTEQTQKIAYVVETTPGGTSFGPS